MKSIDSLRDWTAARRRDLSLSLLPGYFGKVATTWQGILWGGSVLFVIWGIHFIVGNPPTWVNWTAILAALFLAGYYVWRNDHIRLLPKFSVREIKYQPTPTMNSITREPTGTSVWVQLLLRCLTDSPVQECSGHLRQVFRWSQEKQKWEETDMNESVRLGWSHGDEKHSPITLEPRNERRLNLFWIHSSNRTIIPAVYPLPLRAESVFARDDIFLFDVTIRGKDCAPVDVYLRVKRGEQWDKPLVQFVPKPAILNREALI
jgi:hypothetical protein